MTVHMKVKTSKGSKGLTVCPTCKRPLVASPKRICAACGKQITRHHKWMFRIDGKVVHRSCKFPEDYVFSNPY